jgi:hypothetical protein
VDRFDEQAAVLAAPLCLGPNMTARIAAALRDAYERGVTHDAEARRHKLTQHAVRIIFGGGA